MSRYAERTKVPVDRSKAEIEQTLKRYGASTFMYGAKADRAVIMFSMTNRHLRFELPLPQDADARAESNAAEDRRRWRSLVMIVKAKLEAVASGICTFEEEFLAHIVLPGGQTAGQHLIPRIDEAYRSGKVPELGWDGGHG